MLEARKNSTKRKQCLCRQSWKCRGSAPWEPRLLLFLSFLHVGTAVRMLWSRAVCFRAHGGAFILGNPSDDLHPHITSLSPLSTLTKLLPSAASDTGNKPIFSASSDTEQMPSRALGPHSALSVYTPTVLFGSGMIFAIPPLPCHTQSVPSCLTGFWAS